METVTSPGALGLMEAMTPAGALEPIGALIPLGAFAPAGELVGGCAGEGTLLTSAQ